jgi:fluoride ion exporter CrcB/FEX
LEGGFPVRSLIRRLVAFSNDADKIRNLENSVVHGAAVAALGALTLGILALQAQTEDQFRLMCLSINILGSLVIAAMVVGVVTVNRVSVLRKRAQ